MYKSFKETSVNSDLYIAVDADDEDKKEYINFSCDNHIFMTVGMMTTTEYINAIFEQFPNYEFYHLTNDDVIYETKYWDSMMIGDVLNNENKVGIAYGNDGNMGKTLPTMPFISGEIARAVGWLQLPTLTHLCGDMVWKVIGQKLRCLYYLPEISINHKHPLYKKAKGDKTFEKTNSKAMYQEDNYKFREWCSNQCLEDVQKIREATQR